MGRRPKWKSILAGLRGGDRLAPKPRKPNIRTISISFAPAAQNNGGIFSVDIGKYYDDFFTRVTQIWATAYFTDVTAGSRRIEAPCFGFLRNVTVMQLPAASVVVVSGGGVVVQAGSAFFLGQMRNTYGGDVELTEPTFEVSITGEKPTSGGFPGQFTFEFDVTVQLEFGIKEI